MADFSQLEIPPEVQRQWAQMADIEMADQAVVRRDLDGYLLSLKGIAHFLSYVRGRVVDIGAGQAVAINQLAKHAMGLGLDYLATGMVVPQDYPGEHNVPYLQAGAETLTGIEDGSISGALAVHSIIFSAAPDMVVHSLNRALTCGGAFKTNLVINKGGAYVPSTQAAYQSEFETMGYDVAVAPSGKVLLAIKPGGNSSVDAHSLLRADLQSYEQQRRSLSCAS